MDAYEQHFLLEGGYIIGRSSYTGYIDLYKPDFDSVLLKLNLLITKLESNE